MKPTTSTDLIYATLKSMPRPASSNDIYLKLLEQDAYTHMPAPKARSNISARLAELRQKGKVSSIMLESKGVLVWDIIENRVPRMVVEAKTAIQTIEPAAEQQARHSHTEILATALEDIANAILKASSELRRFK